MPVVKIYRGLPNGHVTDPLPVTSAAWIDWRFLLAFLLLLLCFIIILLAVFCVRRRRQQAPTPVDENVSTRCSTVQTLYEIRYDTIRYDSL